jgi:hypothetical protein
LETQIKNIKVYKNFMLKHIQQILAKDFKVLHEVTPITMKKIIMIS